MSIKEWFDQINTEDRYIIIFKISHTDLYYIYSISHYNLQNDLYLGFQNNKLKFGNRENRLLTSRRNAIRIIKRLFNTGKTIKLHNCSYIIIKELKNASHSS